MNFSPNFIILFCLVLSLSAQTQTLTNKSPMSNNPSSAPKYVLGTTLKACCLDPITGYFRDGYCKTDRSDLGTHTICAVMTEEFLAYTKSKGNDLSTPHPAFRFPGLHPGDKWCLCAARWLESYQVGKSPKVVLEATHSNTLSIVKLEYLKERALIPAE